MKIEVTRAFSLAGTVQPVGAVLDVDPLLASELIYNRKALAALDAPEAVKADDAPKATRRKKEATE